MIVSQLLQRLVRMTDDSLKRSRDDSTEEDVGVELPPPIAAGSVEAEEEDGDLVGPVLPPQLKKRKVWFPAERIKLFVGSIYLTARRCAGTRA